jgi:phage terminase large subunit-like protein
VSGPVTRPRKVATTPAERAPSLGPWVCAWIERFLVHSEGDWAGQPFRLRPWQKRILWRLYEIRPDGSRRYRQALLGLPKGNGKTELAAAVGCVEFAGPSTVGGWRNGRPVPVPRVSPNIPVAATSLDQADLLFGAASAMIKSGPLRRFCEVYDTEILLKGRPGRFFRVAAVAGTNDGGKPSFLAGDELHEWTGRKERVHLILSGNVAKRTEAWELDISTAGWDKQSLLGRLYKHGVDVRDGIVEDPQFLFEWREPSFDVDLADKVQLERAIRETNPAVGDFLPLEGILRRAEQIAEHEFRRYHLNQWAQAPERWLPADLWAAAAEPKRKIAKGTAVVLGLDGSYNRDSTALWAGTLDAKPHLELLGAWEKPEGVENWKVPRETVLGAIDDALVKYQVRCLGYDDTFGRLWDVDMEALQNKGVEVAEWPTRSLARMGPASGAFFGGLKDGSWTHDGDPRAARHVANCVGKPTRWGIVPVKAAPNSSERIDIAVAAVVTLDLALRFQQQAGGWLIL